MDGEVGNEVGSRRSAVGRNARIRAAWSWFRFAGAGAGLGLVAFGAETALVLGRTSIGLEVDVEGPYAALLTAVRPHLPGLFARILLAYVVAGAVLGAACGVVASALLRTSALGRWALFLFDFLAVVALVGWHRAIERPALFDDLKSLRPLLRHLVDRGEPWHSLVVAGILAVVHLAFGLWARRGRTADDGEQPMSRWVAVAVAAVVLVGVGGWWMLRGPSGKPGRLVLVIGIDAFRVDRLAAFGGKGEVAPNVEAFLRDATLFKNAWTPIAQTEPAWRALVTARWPHRTGLRYPLTAESRWEEAPTFPGELAKAGWHTSFATDCSRFNHQTERSGFAHRHQPPRGAVNFVLEKLRYRGLGMFADNALGAALLPELLENRALAGLYDPRDYADRLAGRILNAAGQGDALFAFHATAAHFPGDPVHPYYRQFVREDAPFERRLRMYFSPISGATKRAAVDWTRLDAEALYDELLSEADAQLGTLVDALKRRGLYDEATIIVFSDHGESFHADHPELAGATPVHGARLSQEENQILLAMKLPRSEAKAAPRTSNALVRLIDLGPTILDAVDAPALPRADGSSLLPLLRGEVKDLGLTLYAETGYTHASPGAFDPDHLAVAPRNFEVYRVRPDGVVELTDAAHDLVLQEKDVGVYDGRRWLIRSPRTDGTIAERCSGVCPAPPALAGWLDRVSEGAAPAMSERRSPSVPQ